MSIHISFSPNSTWENVKTALSYFILPHKRKYLQVGKYIPKLEKKFSVISNNKYSISFGSGRESLKAILQSFQIQKEDEVILQAFTCIVLVNAVKSVGATPIFIDIKKNSFQINEEEIEKKITGKTKAIIITNMFGQVSNIQAIENIAKNNHLIVINDCAQSLGATYENKPISSFGDISFFSFGRDKIISGISGGMVTTNNKKIADKLEILQKEANQPSKEFVLKQLFHPISASIILPLYNILSLGKIFLLFIQKLHLLTPVITKQEKEGTDPMLLTKLSNAQAEIICQQLRQLEKFNAHRKKIANIYKQMHHTHIIHPNTEVNANDVFLRYSVLVPTPKIWRKYFQKKGIVLGDWYDQVIGPSSAKLDKTGYKLHSCPQAEYASRHVLNLPTHPKISEKQAKKLTKKIMKLANKVPVCCMK